ncbi:MAG: hypothetical protein ABL882_04405 [Sphingopyxis sp.]
MRRWVTAAAVLAALAASAAFARDSLGVFNDWGAFRDPATATAPLRCYAIAQPQSGGAAVRYVTIAYWPNARVRGQVHVRLATNARPGTAVTMRLGSQRFTLVTRGAGAWASNPQMDAAIVAAIRSSQAMSASVNGATASWRLRGAATAIDAAALGCARR